ncbi:MAG: cation:proton antiporter [Deinococcales bacterium]
MNEVMLELTLNLGFIILALAFIFTFIRLVRGPSLPDRVVALDLMSALSIVFIALYSMASDQAVYLDAAIGLALVAFLATVAFARFVEHMAQQQETSKDG